MEHWTDLSQVPADSDDGQRSVVTIGNFDGVHRGHRVVLDQVVDAARARGARAVAVTFTPHPLAVLRGPEQVGAPLVTRERRAELLGRVGVEAVLDLPFTRELAGWGPERFVVDVFVRALRASAVVVGRDVRFGKDNAGDLTTMRDLGAAHGFDVLVCDDAHAEAAPAPGTAPVDVPARRWSSTWVRELLAAGDVEAAAAVLGRPHRVEGIVVHGDHRGRELGYPTANLGDVPVLIPADGVYAGWLVRDAGGAVCEAGEDQGVRVLPAAVSIGTNPTFDGLERRVEAHALTSVRGAPLDLYGEHVGVDLVARLRPTLRFDSVGELVGQMEEDVARARLLLDERSRPTC